MSGQRPDQSRLLASRRPCQSGSRWYIGNVSRLVALRHSPGAAQPVSRLPSAFIARQFLPLPGVWLPTRFAFVTAVLLHLLLLGVHSRRHHIPQSRSRAATPPGQAFGASCSSSTASPFSPGFQYRPWRHQVFVTRTGSCDHRRSRCGRRIRDSSLVAHDRATFGGMSRERLVFLLPALWVSATARAGCGGC